MSLTSLEFTWWSIMDDEDFRYWEEKMRHIQDRNLIVTTYVLR